MIDRVCLFFDIHSRFSEFILHLFVTSVVSSFLSSLFSIFLVARSVFGGSKPVAILSCSQTSMPHILQCTQSCETNMQCRLVTTSQNTIQGIPVVKLWLLPSYWNTWYKENDYIWYIKKGQSRHRVFQMYETQVYVISMLPGFSMAHPLGFIKKVAQMLIIWCQGRDHRGLC